MTLSRPECKAKATFLSPPRYIPRTGGTSAGDRLRRYRSVSAAAADQSSASRATGMTCELLSQIVASKPELAGLPVIANVDFGHSSPVITFPVGGTAELRAVPDAPRLLITSH
jgi:LD-carboxypeptidase C-terminal domain